MPDLDLSANISYHLTIVDADSATGKALNETGMDSTSISLRPRASTTLNPSAPAVTVAASATSLPGQEGGPVPLTIELGLGLGLGVPLLAILIVVAMLLGRLTHRPGCRPARTQRREMTELPVEQHQMVELGKGTLRAELPAADCRLESWPTADSKGKW